MIGLVMDAVLMLVLVCAVGFGIRLDRRLRTLREGQVAFAGAVADLNQAAARAEAALSSLRAAGQETDLLHDRIVRARELKTELEKLIARGENRTPPAVHAALGQAEDRLGRTTTPPDRRGASVRPSAAVMKRSGEPSEDRMAALAQRIQALAAPSGTAGREDVAAIVRAMTANQSAERNPNRTVRAQDDDLFAA